MIIEFVVVVLNTLGDDVAGLLCDIRASAGERDASMFAFAAILAAHRS